MKPDFSQDNKPEKFKTMDDNKLFDSTPHLFGDSNFSTSHLMAKHLSLINKGINDIIHN
jgi:hypothetical protein